MIGLYSAEAASDWGTTTWQTPEGKEVEITAAVDQPSDYKWPDAVIVGPVTKFVRVSSQGSLSFLTGPQKWGNRKWHGEEE